MENLSLEIANHVTDSSVSSDDEDEDDDSSRQVFVANLPHHCTEKDLKILFSRFGDVETVRIHGGKNYQDTR